MTEPEKLKDLLVELGKTYNISKTTRDLSSKVEVTILGTYDDADQVEEVHELSIDYEYGLPLILKVATIMNNINFDTKKARRFSKQNLNYLESNRAELGLTDDEWDNFVEYIPHSPMDGVDVYDISAHLTIYIENDIHMIRLF